VRELRNSATEITLSPVKAASLAGMIKMIDAGTISGKMAKDVLAEMFASGKPVEDVVREMGGAQVSDESSLRELAEQVIAANPKQLEQYRAGKTGLLGFFVGQVMKLSQGRANPQVANKVLKDALEGDWKK
jgi:aspartyl-tRNA(Asn)/glutamyl-tRNA(Gln) amidotransferase subunit B